MVLLGRAVRTDGNRYAVVHGKYVAQEQRAKYPGAVELIQVIVVKRCPDRPAPRHLGGKDGDETRIDSSVKSSQDLLSWSKPWWMRFMTSWLSSEADMSTSRQYHEIATR